MTFDDEALKKDDPRSHFHNSLTTNRAVIAGSMIFLVISALLFTIGLIGIIIPESQRVFAFTALATLVIVLTSVGYYYLIKYNEQMTLDYDENK